MCGFFPHGVCSGAKSTCLIRDVWSCGSAVLLFGSFDRRARELVRV